MDHRELIEPDPPPNEEVRKDGRTREKGKETGERPGKKFPENFSERDVIAAARFVWWVVAIVSVGVGARLYAGNAAAFAATGLSLMLVLAITGRR